MPWPPFTESGDLPLGVHRAAFDEVAQRFGSGTPQRRRVFLRLADGFAVSVATGETRLLFDHLTAETHFGASVFWLRRLAALEGEQAAVEYWQVKRDGQRRGVVEIDLGAS